MRHTYSCIAVAFALVTSLVAGCSETPPAASKTAAQAPTAAPASSPEADEKAARAVFLANIQAIIDKDKDKYLDSYRADQRLVRAGNDGVKLGYAEFAEGAPATGSADWPEKLVAEDVVTHWLAPGVVYGAYRYSVTIKGVTTTGMSERVILRMGDRWKVAVTTAFQDPDKGAPGKDDKADAPTEAEED